MSLRLRISIRIGSTPTASFAKSSSPQGLSLGNQAADRPPPLLFQRWQNEDMAMVFHSDQTSMQTKQSISSSRRMVSSAPSSFLSPSSSFLPAFSSSPRGSKGRKSTSSFVVFLCHLPLSSSFVVFLCRTDPIRCFKSISLERWIDGPGQLAIKMLVSIHSHIYSGFWQGSAQHSLVARISHEGLCGSLSLSQYIRQRMKLIYPFVNQNRGRATCSTP